MINKKSTKRTNQSSSYAQTRISDQELYLGSLEAPGHRLSANAQTSTSSSTTDKPRCPSSKVVANILNIKLLSDGFGIGIEEVQSSFLNKTPLVKVMVACGSAQ